MSQANRNARTKSSTRDQIELEKLNILARIEQHLAVLSEPIRRQLMAEQLASQAAQGTPEAGGEEE